MPVLDEEPSAKIGQEQPVAPESVPQLPDPPAPSSISCQEQNSDLESTTEQNIVNDHNCTIAEPGVQDSLYRTRYGRVCKPIQRYGI